MKVLKTISILLGLLIAFLAGFDEIAENIRELSDLIGFPILLPLILIVLILILCWSFVLLRKIIEHYKIIKHNKEMMFDPVVPKNLINKKWIMKYSKIIFLFFLILVFVSSIIHFSSLKEPSTGAYSIIIVSFISLSAYFAVVFLDLEIDGKLISLRKQVLSLENSQKELSKLATALYKISLLNTVSRGMIGDLNRFAEEHDKIVNDIEQYIDENEIEQFAVILDDIRKNPN